MSRKKPSVALNKVQGPGFLKYDLSNIPPKLRKKGNVSVASSSSKSFKKSQSLSLFNEDMESEVPATLKEVSAASCSIPVNDIFKLYCLGIVETQYFCPCNGSMTVFALADFDETSKELKRHKIQTVRRKAVKFEGDAKWICFCSCNPVHAEYADALSANLLTSYADFSEMTCMHIKMVKKFMNDLDDISPDVYFSEHSYGKKETDGLILKEDADLVELPFGDDYCLVLCGVMPGVVTVSARKLQCFTCQNIHCCHTNLMQSYMKKSNTYPVPDIVLKLMKSMKDETTSKTFIYQTLSKRSIQFRQDVSLRATFLDPVSHCVKEDGVLQFFPFESDICTNCGSQLKTDCSLQGNQPIPFFCKYEVYEVSYALSMHTSLFGWRSYRTWDSPQISTGCHISKLDIRGMLFSVYWTLTMMSDSSVRYVVHHQGLLSAMLPA